MVLIPEDDIYRAEQRKILAKIEDGLSDQGQAPEKKRRFSSWIRDERRYLVSMKLFTQTELIRWRSYNPVGWIIWNRSSQRED